MNPRRVFDEDLRNSAAVIAPPQRPPVFLMSPMSLLISSAYSSPRGSRQNFSPEVASAASNFAQVASSLEKAPALT